MNYHVYIVDKGGRFLVGSTKFYDDAKLIYNNWNTAYIVSGNGVIMDTKNGATD